MLHTRLMKVHSTKSGGILLSEVLSILDVTEGAVNCVFDLGFGAL